MNQDAKTFAALRCPSCCSTKTERSETGRVMFCRDCDWTWCPDAAEEARAIANALYGWAMNQKGTE
jgi:ribosomal protein L37AE/L43A